MSVKSNELDEVVTKGKRREEALAHFLVELPELMAWSTGHAYLGHNIVKKENHWLIVVKGEKSGSRYVGFVTGTTLLIAYRNLWGFVVQGHGSWKPDRMKN